MPEIMRYSQTYDQFILWFSHLLNEIQNGTPCPIYTRLLNGSRPDATFITFNWDTILDRALAETGEWFPDDGYGIQFNQLLEGGWRAGRQTTSKWQLLKLHGSTNWFSPYVTLDFRDGTRKWVTTSERLDWRWCLVNGNKWYDTYKDRWRPGYQPYSYFFPPNDDLGQPLMPIIIPPTRLKNFCEHGDLFSEIWSRAESRLADATRLVICGYSFPETDNHAYELIETFLLDGRGKEIQLVDPYPSSIVDRLNKRISRRCKLNVVDQTLKDYVGLPPEKRRVRLFATSSEIKLKDSKLRKKHAKNPRLRGLFNMIITLNLSRQPVDITAYSGRRLLECEIIGEFATHMMCAYRPETYDYRVQNIRVKPREGCETTVSLDDVWLLNPMPVGGFTEAELKGVDLGTADKFDPLLGCSLRESIRCGYHCKSEGETDVFLRRFIAS
jgi:hypothetical protein